MEVAVEQVEQLASQVPTDARILADRWYATGPFVQACARLQIGTLMRCKRNRKVYRRAQAHVAGKRGAPRKDGELLQGSRPQTWGEPDARWSGQDEAGRPILVQAWHHVHFRQARSVELTLFRVLRPQARSTKRDPQESWFVWVGKEPLPLFGVAASYKRRFSQEHTSRFLKQELLWTKARVRTPAQFERWSVVVATAMNQLVLAKKTGQALFHPWERRRDIITPRQLRRMMPAILGQVGTPALSPKPRGKSPGRAGGRRQAPALQL